MSPTGTEEATRSTRIPRLQELSFLEVAMVGVAAGTPFEGIRRGLIDHMVALREESDATGNTASFRTAKDDPKRYVSNVSQSLKELMLLGLVEGAAVPSSARAAQNYTAFAFTATDKGVAWAQLLKEDWPAACDQLLDMLWHAHPQFRAFLSALDIRGLVVPLLPWSETPEPRNRDQYLESLSPWVARHLEAEESGWASSMADIKEAVEEYLNERYENAHARGREEPYPKNRDFVNACEEALVKLAFARCGVALDYISQEVLRRWTKYLGVANFSYHVPRHNALRLWATASIHETGEGVEVNRHVGPEIVQRTTGQLPSAYGEVRRRNQRNTLWVPIHEVRASACWRLGLSDGVFEDALVQVLTGDSNCDIPFRINLDPAQFGTVPPSELPLRLQTRRGIQTYYVMSLIPKR